MLNGICVLVGSERVDSYIYIDNYMLYDICVLVGLHELIVTYIMHGICALVVSERADSYIYIYNVVWYLCIGRD